MYSQSTAITRYGYSFPKKGRHIIFFINKALSEVTRRSEEQMEHLNQDKGTLRLQVAIFI